MNEKQETIAQIQQKLKSGSFDTHWMERLRQDERKGVQKLLSQYDKKLAFIERQQQEYALITRYEKEWQAQGYRYIAGVDEVGRGPLAGPVTAGAVILPADTTFPGLTDSKKLSREKREAFYQEITEKAVAYHVVHIAAEHIDSMNIYQASIAAMEKAVQGLQVKADAVFVDALALSLPVQQLSLTKGDAKSASIAAASVLAKVERDYYMTTMASRYPEYGFDQHMGYGTKQHVEALKKYGATAEHRQSFAPVKACLR
ncbi:RNase HII [Alteribacillus persepolensis]|uniref:Ribonuclease HII n=1 Tax=Alteribacillus persepolensis TaxID=568899 RepID=A0A1G7YL84_9BACI|nr:ribonuclease HII [Alteribacillus persepolensis]SDG97261.1 RNase HII [Alteribacillus persepolensis]